jgi:hypothetical protein
MKRFVSFFPILILVSMMLSTLGYTQPKNDPVKIDFVYAPEKIHRGGVWKIYLSVTDDEAKMNRVYFQVKQFGGTDSYKPTFVYLKKGMEKHFTGHFDLHTSASVEVDDLVLQMAIVDSQGNTRKTLSLPLEFSEGAEPMKPFPPELEKDLNRRIGTIDIDWDISAD